MPNNLKKNIRILFVCMGNICRSPAAEGVCRQMIKQELNEKIEIESCGIGDWHIGQPPDRRMQEAAKARGIALNSRAQQFKIAFYDEFDYILASDQEVLKHLFHCAATPEHKAKLSLMTAFSGLYSGQEVPDPYYEPTAAFDLVLDMLEDSCSGLLKHISKEVLE